ncbi:helix-turn-helix domain-containing protein [Paenibacillus mucilaginosus]|uniref:Transcriptional regulator, AraC family n=1 Tax=Paenibacillus mucilaginosus (strain KNP414) TaxID=1036673 RepID=F8F5E4_PAEMK|nr:helix-turn-helix domain-containing protein [Paenibacillus mucilaginosus]AEI40955.1 transcriptional regulator, AraC family [Paenibacillus mucilaginosus KNP414]MCG7211595.1 helix-turn-helix domain-containing protein [Paenibacillus mucilaginosus]WDM30041.1 helix-turn-helix domain-containing protein [Paenibacillus mucilaginosus]
MPKHLEPPALTPEEAGGTVIAGHFDEGDRYVTSRPAGRKDWLLTYTLGGEGYYETPEGELHCRRGDLVLLKPDTPHKYGTVKGGRWEFMWVHFSERIGETGMLPAAPLLLHQVSDKPAGRRIYRAFRRILTDSVERNAYWQELCEQAIREILLLLAQSMNRGMDPRIRSVLHLLSSRLREGVRIEEAARTAGLSPSRLSHLFKAETGLSIIETLNRMRVQQAALLLRHTDRTALEVSQDVGYQNYHHFAAQFRRAYGVNPSTYKSRESGTSV